MTAKTRTDAAKTLNAKTPIRLMTYTLLDPPGFGRAMLDSVSLDSPKALQADHSLESPPPATTSLWL